MSVCVCVRAVVLLMFIPLRFNVHVFLLYSLFILSNSLSFVYACNNLPFVVSVAT